MNIVFITSSEIYNGNRFFDVSADRDNIREPFFVLKKKIESTGGNLNTIDQYQDLSLIDVALVVRFEYNLRILLNLIRANPKIKIIFLVTEEQNIAPIYQRNVLNNKLFDCVLTLRDDFVDNKFFLKYHYPNPYRIMVSPNKFNEKKYLVMINSNKKHRFPKSGDLYIERIKAINFFEKKSKLDLYGMGWGSSKNKSVKKVYLGSVDSKIETLKKYKFSLAFENSNNEIGGIFEKIYDVMAAGCVPIYWGAPNVLDYIPGEAFIDYREFENYEQLDDFLNNMSEDTYNEYLKAISKFLSSQAYFKFTTNGYVDIVSKTIDIVKQKQNIRKVNSIKWDLFKRIIHYPELFFKNKRLFWELLVG